MTTCSALRYPMDSFVGWDQNDNIRTPRLIGLIFVRVTLGLGCGLVIL
jgi:hypothetical protein